MTIEARYDQVISWFSANMPDASTELEFKDPFQLLVAVILSAQCTDKRVNAITPAFFKAYPNAEVLAKSTPRRYLNTSEAVLIPTTRQSIWSAWLRLSANNSTD
jgi:endonuclease-3